MTVHVTSPVVPFSELGDGGGEALAERDTTEYVGNFIFRNAGLERINFDGGYMDFSNDSLNTPQYHYYTTDHLGNIRAVFDDNGTVEQITTYDPFGMIIPELSSGQSLQPYKYNGKEFDRMHGLDWYDYGARMYDPALPSWTSVDPLAEKYYNTSPYVYCHNSPACRIDSNGADDWEFNKYGVITNHVVNSNRDAFLMAGTNNSVTFPYGTVENNWSSLDKENASYDVFQIRGNQYAKQAFEFLADNTEVEWTHYELGSDGNNELNTISTSHDTKYDSSGGELADNYISKNGLLVKSHTHNHPSGLAVPSGIGSNDNGGDFSFIKKMRELYHTSFSNTTFKVYASHKYNNYDENSKPEDFQDVTVDIDEIIVTLPK